MKKGVFISHIIFTGLSLVGLVIWIVAMVVATSNTSSSATYDQWYSTYQTSLALAYTSSAIEITSVIGTLVTSIILLTNAKHYSRPGLIKGSGIVGIVGGGLGIIFSIVAFTVNTIPLIVSIILIIVSFGLGIGAYARAKKEYRCAA